MTDPRVQLRELRTRRLRARAKIRALAANLAAAEHAVRRDAQRNPDPMMSVLIAQLQGQRRSLDALGDALDVAGACTDAVCSAIETEALVALVAAARVAAPATSGRRALGTRRPLSEPG